MKKNARQTLIIAGVALCGALTLSHATAAQPRTLTQNPAYERIADMSNANIPDVPTAGQGAVNWDAPSKRDLVERAMSDGITNPAQIVAWAHGHNVNMTTAEVIDLKTQLGRK